MIHHHPGSEIDPCRDTEGEVSMGSIITIRRDAIVTHSRKFGIPKSDLSNTASAIVSIVQEAWTGLGTLDLTNLDLEDVDAEAIHRDSTYYEDGKPGPGLIEGLRHLPDLHPIRGTSALYRVGQLIELHGLYTIKAPADFGEAWPTHLVALGQEITRAAGSISALQPIDLPDLRMKLGQLGNSLDLLVD